MKYEICCGCGCHLDFGERCDCKEQDKLVDEKLKKLIRVESNGQMIFDFRKAV